MWYVVAILPNRQFTRVLEFRTEKQAWEWIAQQKDPTVYDVRKKQKNRQKKQQK